MTRYKRKTNDEWRDWPQHVTAPLPEDFDDVKWRGTPVQVSKTIQITPFIGIALYMEDGQGVVLCEVMFPNGSVWRYVDT